MNSWFALIPIALVLAGCGSDQETGSGSDGEDLPALQPYKYKAGVGGLKQLMGDLLDALSRGDRATARMLVKSFRVPDHESWFAEFFGADVSKEMAAEYDGLSRRITQLSDLLADLQARGHTVISVESFESHEDPAAVEYQAQALKRMDRAIPLYSVRLSAADGKKTFHLWSFVYDHGIYRYIGKTKALADEPSASSGDDGIDLREYRIKDRTKVREMSQQPEKSRGKPRRGSPRQNK